MGSRSIDSDGECVGMHGAGMLARWAVGCAWGWNAGGGIASFVVLPRDPPQTCATSLWNIGTWTMFVE